MTLTEIGGYRLERELGSGGMGVVYLGYDAEQTPVAVKVLHPHIANDETARARLAREVRTLRRIKHPRIAEVFDAELDGPQPFLVTQYVDGPTLAQDVRTHGPFDQAELVHFGHALLDALGAVHAAGVIHRDLKPANVMIMNGEPMVIDFGIAQVADEIKVTATGLVMGTPGYLSPELADGRDATEATDWWGWGATVAFAATGENPFGSGPLEAVLGRVATGRVKLDDAPAGFVPLLKACLAPRPEDRPAPREILAALVDIEEGKVPVIGIPGNDGEAATSATVARPAPEGPTTVLPAAGATSVYPGGQYPGPARPVTPLQEPPGGGSPGGVGSGAPDSAVPGGVAQGNGRPVGPQPVPLPSARQSGYAGGSAYAPAPQQPASGGYYGANGVVPAGGSVGPLGITSINTPVPQATGPMDETESGPHLPATHGRTRANGGGWAVAALVFAGWAIAPFAPLLVLLLVYLWQIVTRTVGSVLGRRYRRELTYGPQAGSGGGSGGAGAAVGSIFTSLFCLILPVLAAGAVGILVKLDLFGWLNGWAADHAALLAAAAAGAVVLWLGPGSRNLRRGSVGLARNIMRGSLLGELLTTLGLMIIGCVAVSSGLANDVVNWWPLTFDPLEWLNNTRDTIGSVPGL